MFQADGEFWKRIIGKVKKCAIGDFVTDKIKNSDIL